MQKTTYYDSIYMKCPERAHQCALPKEFPLCPHDFQKLLSVWVTVPPSHFPAKECSSCSLGFCHLGDTNLPLSSNFCTKKCLQGVKKITMISGKPGLWLYTDDSNSFWKTVRCKRRLGKHILHGLQTIKHQVAVAHVGSPWPVWKGQCRS